MDLPIEVEPCERERHVGLRQGAAPVLDELFDLGDSCLRGDPEELAPPRCDLIQDAKRGTINSPGSSAAPPRPSRSFSRSEAYRPDGHRIDSVEAPLADKEQPPRRFRRRPAACARRRDVARAAIRARTLIVPSQAHDNASHDTDAADRQRSREHPGRVARPVAPRPQAAACDSPPCRAVRRAHRAPAPRRTETTRPRHVASSARSRRSRGSSPQVQLRDREARYRYALHARERARRQHGARTARRVPGDRRQRRRH